MVEPFRPTEMWQQIDEPIKHAIRTNVLASINHLRHGSQTLEQLVDNEGLIVVGAEYDLESSKVNFFDKTTS